MQVKAKDIMVNYELSGKQGASVVMLSHSLGSGLVMWDPQMELLEPHFRVLRYNTRGHGGTDAPEGAYTLEQLGEDAIALMDALNIDVVHWVGLSMGGMIGQYIALNHAHRLRSLALCDTRAISPEESQLVWQKRIETARKSGMKALLEAALERWFTPSYLSQNPPQLEVIRKQFLATPVAGFVGCAEALRRLNYLEQLSEVTTPTLIIVGEDDPGTPVEASEAMHERIPNSRLVVLPSARHFSNVEQADAFNRALIEFLQEH